LLPYVGEQAEADCTRQDKHAVSQRIKSETIYNCAGNEQSDHQKKFDPQVSGDSNDETAAIDKQVAATMDRFDTLSTPTN
jgi:hypothetical protein